MVQPIRDYIARKMTSLRTMANHIELCSILTEGTWSSGSLTQDERDCISVLPRQPSKAASPWYTVKVVLLPTIAAWQGRKVCPFTSGTRALPCHSLMCGWRIKPLLQHSTPSARQLGDVPVSLNCASKAGNEAGIGLGGRRTQRILTGCLVYTGRNPSPTTCGSDVLWNACWLADASLCHVHWDGAVPLLQHNMANQVHVPCPQHFVPFQEHFGKLPKNQGDTFWEAQKWPQNSTPPSLVWLNST